MTTTINGVPADQWGTWCPHNIRIVEPDPNALYDDYQFGRIVDLWPCDQGCTREQFERDLAEGAKAYEADRWAEYRHLIG